MIAADNIKNFITPMLPGWRIQFGRWTDSDKVDDRFAVIKPVGGGLATLVRRPQFTLLLIGAKADAATVPSMKADSIVEAMRKSNGGLVCMRAGEPVYSFTGDGRHTYELSISTITN
jgi:hypothetical protein